MEIGPIKFNPAVCVLALTFLWAFAGYAMQNPEESGSVLKKWEGWITQYFSWFYLGSRNIWLIFLAVVYYYYGGAKLGRDDEKPEFDNATYFMMLFAAGCGTGFVFYAVAEPLQHLASGEAGQGLGKDMEGQAQFALTQTVFHWGLHNWVVYTIVGILSGFLTYRKGLPMTIRSCFFPLLGEHTWGWIGDVIDAFSIVTIIAGLCTSLGLGAFQIVEGMQRIGSVAEDASEEDLRRSRLWVVWMITACATVSVVSGLHYGIKALSQVVVALGAFLWTTVVWMDQTQFALNAVVQTTGDYLQWLPKLSWRTDAFGQLKAGEGRFGDNPADGTSWMDDNTVFIWH